MWRARPCHRCDPGTRNHSKDPELPRLPSKPPPIAPALTKAPGICSLRNYLRRSRSSITGSGSLLVSSGPGEDVSQTVIPFMAGVFKQRTHALLHGQFCGPGSCPSERIFDGESIEDRVLGHAGEALNQTHILAGSLESGLVVEVRCLHDQGLPFPAAA